MERSTAKDEFENELSQLKEDLTVYRELIIKFNNVLEWEQSIYPVILTLTVSTIYILAWLLSPSFLTIFSLCGVLYFSLDFFGPKFLPVLHKFSEWDLQKESRFQSICIRFLNGKKHFLSCRNNLMQLEKTSPKLYYPLMVILCSIFMWLGLNINSFIVSYVLSIIILLLPGLRKHATRINNAKQE